MCAHLKKKCFGEADRADNLTSWSSSMLFVLQYATWRCSIGHRSLGDTYICVVDATRLPRGQFARDTWLLEQSRGSQNAGPKIQDEFRLREHGYDNGEHLSQGLLVQRWRISYNRDCPSFIRSWTFGLGARSTSHEELQRASYIATTCLGELQPCELAIYLLSLKNRRLKSGLSAGTIPVIGR